MKIELDVRNAVRSLDELGKIGQPRIRKALKRTATTTEVFLARQVAADTGLKLRTVREQIRTRIEANGFTATITAKGARVALIDFKARGPEPSKGKGRGVSASIQGQRRRYPHAFIATMSTGHRGVFQRKGTARLPIRELYGPSVPLVFSKFLPEAAKRAQDALVKNVASELQFALSQLARKG